MKKLRITLSVFAMIFIGSMLMAIGVGDRLPQVQLKTFNLQAEKWEMGGIPYLGSKVLTIFYTDVDVADMNDPLSNAIKAKNYPPIYKGIGIGNSKDAPFKPDVFIRMAAKKKMKQFPGSVILLDETYAFRNALGLGDCNQKAVVLVVGKDGKIKYFKKISSAAESQAQIAEVIPILNRECGVK